MTDETRRADREGPTHRHADAPVRTAGADPSDAVAGAVVLHGRGATARGILGLVDGVDAEGVAYLAPQAADRTWYPRSFMAPLEANDPALRSALRTVDEAVATLTAAGIPRERIVLLGFSQGACLASEYVARTPGRYGGLAALSGGLIGPEGTAFDYDGDLAGTPAFLGCSDQDPHNPLERVEETAAVLADLGADVETRIYPGMPHTVNEEERSYVAGMLRDVVRE